MTSASAHYLNQREPKTLDAAVNVHPADGNGMAGCYADGLKDSMRDKAVIVVGAGEVYQKMIGPALKQLGVAVHLYDPKADLQLNFGEHQLHNTQDAPAGLPVFILSPNDLHMWQARQFIEKGHPVACEKPICLPEEVDRLREVVKNAKVPTYWIDFNHMMGRGLIALAGGVKMPFMDDEAVKLESDTSGQMAQAIRNGTPLIPGKITKVTGRYFQASASGAGTLAHRAWQMQAGKGGGMLRDLMTRMFNMTQLMGLEPDKIGHVDLRVAGEKPGEYHPLASADQAEQRADVKGTMQKDGSETQYDFAVGKYAAKDELFLKLEYDNGDTLTLDWLPPNRKNSVTWRDSSGQIKGVLHSRVDPYLLIVKDALSHLHGKDTYPMYFEEQAKSVEVLGRAAAMGRAGLPSVSRAAAAG